MCWEVDDARLQTQPRDCVAYGTLEDLKRSEHAMGHVSLGKVGLATLSTL